MISEELKRKLIEIKIDPYNVVDISTKNIISKRIIITKITLADGTKHELIEDFIFYAARKNKSW